MLRKNKKQSWIIAIVKLLFSCSQAIIDLLHDVRNFCINRAANAANEKLQKKARKHASSRCDVFNTWVGCAMLCCERLKLSAPSDSDRERSISFQFQIRSTYLPCWRTARIQCETQIELLSLLCFYFYYVDNSFKFLYASESRPASSRVAQKRAKSCRAVGPMSNVD